MAISQRNKKKSLIILYVNLRNLETRIQDIMRSTETGGVFKLKKTKCITKKKKMNSYKFTLFINWKKKMI